MLMFPIAGAILAQTDIGNRNVGDSRTLTGELKEIHCLYTEANGGNRRDDKCDQVMLPRLSHVRFGFFFFLRSCFELHSNWCHAWTIF
jgi:hypothetical protein